MSHNIRELIDAGRFSFHIRELNWALAFVFCGFVAPSGVFYFLDIISRVMPYRSLASVLTPLEWVRLPFVLFAFLVAFYSLYRFVRNETDTCLVLFPRFLAR